MRLVSDAKSTHDLSKHLHAWEHEAQMCRLIRIRELFIEIDKLCSRNMGSFKIRPSRNNIVGLIFAWYEMRGGVKDDDVRVVKVFC